MKKAKKILLKVLQVVMLALVVFVSFGSNVLATNDLTQFPNPEGTEIAAVKTVTGNVWSTVLSILQILAFAAIIIAGVRYMFASADQKADIKKGLIYLVIGAILVFASSTIVKVVVNATKQASGETTGRVELVQEIEKV